MTLEEFKEYYSKYGRLPNDISVRKGKMNELQLETRYKKYIQQTNNRQRESKKIVNREYTSFIDDKWEELKSKLDLTECQLIKRLKEEKQDEAIKELKKNAKWLLKTIDPAHIFSRSGYPYLKYELENVVPLNRFSHSCLDTMRDPITGKNITKEEHKLFWMFIAGIDVYKRLEQRIREHD